jgi:HlyD family secretion protein
MNQQDSQNGKKAIFWAIGSVVALAAAIFLIRSCTREDVPVRTARASYQDLVTSISTNGKVEPVENFEAHAPAPGVVEDVRVREGDKVSAGTLLLQMDLASANARLAAAQSAVASAQSSATAINRGGSQDERLSLSGDLDRARLQLQQDQKNLAALQALQAKGASSPSEISAARDRVATSQSTFNTLQQRSTSRFDSTDQARAKAQLGDAYASLAAAQKVLSDNVVRAPFASTVYSLPVRKSDFVNGGDVLLRLADLTRMEVRAYFDEPEIGKLSVGQAVRITWDAKPNRVWHGHTVHVPTTIVNYGTRNVGECLIAIDDADGDLLPNTNVNVTVTTQQKLHVLTVPREALRIEGPQNFVYRIVENKLVRTPIRVGDVNLVLVNVQSGLNEGDVVALNATTSADLSDGIKVKPVK